MFHDGAERKRREESERTDEEHRECKEKHEERRVRP